MSNSLETSNSGNNNGMNNNDSESNPTDHDLIATITTLTRKLDVIFHGQAISGIAEFFGIENKTDADVIKGINEVVPCIFVEKSIDGITSYWIGENYQSSNYIKPFVRGHYKKILEQLKPPAKRSEEEFIDFLDQIKFKSQKSVNEDLTGRVNQAEEKVVDPIGQELDEIKGKLDDLKESINETHKKISETHKKVNETHKKISETHKKVSETHKNVNELKIIVQKILDRTLNDIASK